MDEPIVLALIGSKLHELYEELQEAEKREEERRKR